MSGINIVYLQLTKANHMQTTTINNFSLEGLIIDIAIIIFQTICAFVMK